MLIKGLEEVNLNQLEYGFLVEDSPVSSSAFKMHIPKIMPLVGASEKSVRATVNNNIFVNASDCKPKVGTAVQTQGFVTVPPFRNVDLTFKDPLTLIIKKGERMIVACMDSNIKDFYVTDNI